MPAHVGADAGGEGLFAEIALQHADERLPLDVSDRVEGGHRLGFVRDGMLDRVSRALGVFGHRALLAGIAVEPGLPIRVQVLAGFGLHPARKALVEPNVVPPRHGDEIAEPLMRHLMSEDGKDAASRIGRIARRIEQQAALEKRDAAPVLHGAAEAAGNRDQVELGQRIGDAEIVVVVAQQVDRAVEREAALRRLAARGDDSDGDVVDLGGDALELADGEDEEIARHARRRREGDALEAIAGRFLLDDRHVGDRQEMLGDGGGQREARLEGRLIPAWKDAARVGRLEMR